MKPFFIWAGICSGLLLACLFFRAWPMNAYLATATLLFTGAFIVFICARR